MNTVARLATTIAGGLRPGLGGGDVFGLTNLHKSHPSTRVPFLALHVPHLDRSTTEPLTSPWIWAMKHAASWQGEEHAELSTQTEDGQRREWKGRARRGARARRAAPDL